MCLGDEVIYAHLLFKSVSVSGSGVLISEPTDVEWWGWGLL